MPNQCVAISSSSFGFIARAGSAWCWAQAERGARRCVAPRAATVCTNVSGSRDDADGVTRLEFAQSARVSRHRPGHREGRRAFRRADRALLRAGKPRAPHRRSYGDRCAVTGDAGFLGARRARSQPHDEATWPRPRRPLPRPRPANADRDAARSRVRPSQLPKAPRRARSTVAPRYVDEYSSDASRIAVAAPTTWFLKQSVGPPE